MSTEGICHPKLEHLNLNSKKKLSLAFEIVHLELVLISNIMVKDFSRTNSSAVVEALSVV